MELDYTNLPQEEIELRIASLANFLAAHPDIRPNILVDAEAIDFLAKSVHTALRGPVTATAQVTDDTPPPFDGDDAPVEPKEASDTSGAANAPNREDVKPVKRRSRAEMAAGMSNEQAARYRAYGDRGPAAWLRHIGEAPDEPVPDEKPAAEEAPAAEKPAAEEPDTEPDTEGPLDDDDDEKVDLYSGEIEPIEYSVLQEAVFSLVKADMKSQAKHVANEIFGVKTFTELTDPVDFAKAKIILDEIAENDGQVPSKGRIQELLKG